MVNHAFYYNRIVKTFTSSIIVDDVNVFYQVGIELTNSRETALFFSNFFRIFLIILPTFLLAVSYIIYYKLKENSIQMWHVIRVLIVLVLGFFLIGIILFLIL